MGEEVGLVLEMVDGDDVLVDRIMDVGNLDGPFLPGQFNVLEIADRIVGHIAKKAIVDELESVPTYLEPFCKVVDKRGDLATPGKFDGFLFPVRELLDQ